MKIKVTNRSVELKLSPEELKGLIDLSRTVSSKILVDTEMKNRADSLVKQLEAAQTVMEDLSWMDGM